MTQLDMTDMLYDGPWQIDVELIDEWLMSLDDESHLLVIAAMDVLRRIGPQLGRPLVDTVKGSRHHNMKELRPGSSGRTELRLLFVFDPTRRAIFLVAGDKSGDWSRWYRKNIAKADRLYEEHLGRLRRG